MARQTFVASSLLAISIGTGVGWAAPPRPVAVSPGDAGVFSRVAQSCPTFSWGGVEGAVAYELVVFAVDRAVLEESQLGEPRVPRLQVALPGTAFSFTPSMDRCLEPGGRYAWFVRALGTGVEEWSQAKVFQVSSRPSIAEVEEALQVLRRYRSEERDEALNASPQDEGTEIDTAEVDTVTASIARSAGLDRRHRAAGAEAAQRKTERAEPLESRLGRMGAAARPRSAAVEKQQEQEALNLRSAAARAPAPTLGTASLIVDQQVHLGAASSVFKEGELFLWGDGEDENTALGTRALSSNTIGMESTAVGYRALQANTEGSGNTAVGSRALRSNTTGRRNTASGSEALHDNDTGDGNTASGHGALHDNTTGSRNTASGVDALLLNTTGTDSTAVGYRALASNTGHAIQGSYHTAVGSMALYANTTGYHNTAIGVDALRSNTTGYYNTASGSAALRSNTTGYFNTASGAWALLSNTTGQSNTASGPFALRDNSTGNYNTASGSGALIENSTGAYNTASGAYALERNTTGSRNVAIGYLAGGDATTGDDNIFISNLGYAGDAHTIRIGGTTGSGEEQQNRTFIAGIRGIATGNATAIPVVIDSDGQLGTISSSRRYKEEIHDMAEASAEVLELRPVTFRYKPGVAGEDRPLQFGLIAEEVAEIYPELVAYDEDGLPETVLYHFLSSMLLNEVQKQHVRIEAQAAQLAAQEQELGELRTRLVLLEARPRGPTLAATGQRRRVMEDSP